MKKHSKTRPAISLLASENDCDQRHENRENNFNEARN